MARTSLRTFICGVPAGTLTQDENGLISFIYDQAYDGPALSTNMPVSNRTYGQQFMNPYLFGLLPDSEDQRKAIATEFDVRPNNPVALLSHIGLDCPGGAPKKISTPSCIASANTALYTTTKLLSVSSRSEMTAMHRG